MIYTLVRSIPFDYDDCEGTQYTKSCNFLKCALYTPTIRYVCLCMVTVVMCIPFCVCMFCTHIICIFFFIYSITLWSLMWSIKLCLRSMMKLLSVSIGFSSYLFIVRSFPSYNLALALPLFRFCSHSCSLLPPMHSLSHISSNSIHR